MSRATDARRNQMEVAHDDNSGEAERYREGTAERPGEPGQPPGVGQTLEQLADTANRAHADAEQKATGQLRDARTAGEALNGAKALILYGEFGRWIDKNCDFAPSTARLYMRVDREWPRIEEELQRVRTLSLRRAASIIYGKDKPEESQDDDGAVVDEEAALEPIRLTPDVLDGLSPVQRRSVLDEVTEAYRELCEEAKPADWTPRKGEVTTTAHGLRLFTIAVIKELKEGLIGHAGVRSRIRVDELVRGRVPLDRWPGREKAPGSSSKKKWGIKQPPAGEWLESYTVQVTFRSPGEESGHKAQEC